MTEGERVRIIADSPTLTGRHGTVREVERRRTRYGTTNVSVKVELDAPPPRFPVPCRLWFRSFEVAAIDQATKEEEQ